MGLLAKDSSLKLPKIYQGRMTSSKSLLSILFCSMLFTSGAAKANVQLLDQSITEEKGLNARSSPLDLAFRKIVVKNWSNIPEMSSSDWSDEIYSAALDIASSNFSSYVSESLKKIPFVLNASFESEFRTRGSTTIGADVLLKAFEFKDSTSDERQGLAFLHTKYQGSISDGSTINIGTGVRHLLNSEAMAGVNTYWDYRITNYSSSYSRFGIGTELFWKYLSARNNWYINGTANKELNIDGTIYYERVVPGWDIELGYRLPQYPQLGIFVKGFNWDYQHRPNNTGVQGTLSWQATPQLRLDTWASQEIPANATVTNEALPSHRQFTLGMKFVLTANKVIYDKTVKSLLQQEMTQPVRRRYDILLERWKKGASAGGGFVAGVGGA